MSTTRTATYAGVPAVAVVHDPFTYVVHLPAGHRDYGYAPGSTFYVDARDPELAFA